MISGLKMSMTFTIKKITIYGTIPFTTSMYGRLKMAQAVNILTPNGGVTVPNVACNVIKIPIATGWMSAATAIGKKIGVNIAIATSESTNIHDTKKNADIIIKICSCDGSCPSTVSVNSCGMRKYEMIQENAPPAASKMNTILVTTPVEMAIR